MGVAVGIDLGTTNSCVAVVQADKAKIVADRTGRRIHPSIVSYLPDGAILAGQAAKERLIIDSKNTIYSFKRLLGRDFTSGEMQRVLSSLLYEVHLGPGDIPAVQVHGREISLPEVSAMMLRHLKKMCKETLGVEIDEAVITVPANFNDVQRSSTKVAGRIAGFNVLRILNEPTAAALAYGIGSEKSERIAIYDFGGGTFDITIVEVSNDVFEVLATAGESFLGGDDFDKTLVEEMRTGFKRKYKFDFAEDNVAAQRLRAVAEQVKCQLSSLDEVQATLRRIAVDPTGGPIDFDFKIARHRFENLVKSLVEKSLSVCDDALRLSGVERSSLDALILVGGTTRIPLVRKRVAEYFQMEPLSDINPDEVVAIGAAIQAFSLTGKQLNADADLPTPVRRTTSVRPPHATYSGPKKPVRSSAIKMPPIPVTTPPVPDAPLPKPVIDAPLPRPVAKAPPVPTAARAIKDTMPSRVPSKVAEKQTKSLPPIMNETEPTEPDFPNLDSSAEEEPSERWPAVLSTPEPTEFETETQDEEDSWFGVVSDSPIPGSENDSITGVSGLPSRSSAPESLDALDDLAPPARLSEPGAPQTEINPHSVQAQSKISLKEFYPVPPKAALLLDVTPRGLGVATAGGYYDTIIERNAPIPIEQSRLFTTSTDNQTEVSIDIYQGEAKRIQDNTKLGQILLTNIRPAHRGEVKIRVTFEIDTDGILGVFAKNEETQTAQSTRIALTGSMDEKQVESLVQKYAEK